MRTRIVIVGRDVPADYGDMESAERWAPSDLAKRSIHDVAAIVLLRDAIRALGEVRIRAALGPAARRALICVGEISDGALVQAIVRLGRAGARVVRPGELRLEVLALAARAHRAPRSVRPAIAPDLWLPPCRSPEPRAARAVAAVPRLARVDVAAWQRSLRWTPSMLARVCRSAFGSPPRRLLQRYLLAVDAEMRARGLKQEVRAERVGLSDSRSLRRALRAAHLAISAGGAVTGTVPLPE